VRASLTGDIRCRMRACVHRVTKKGKVLGVIEISPTDGKVLGKITFAFEPRDSGPGGIV